MSTQSGALGLAILDYARQLGIGISSFVSVGNKADVSGNDLIQYWAQDPRTSVILLYLESFGNPKKFSEIARRVSRAKPIVAVKAGRSRAGARAAQSHTGALAVPDSVVDGLFRQAGVIRTDTLEQMFDVAALLAHQPLPRGRRVAILTNAGGPGDPGGRRLRGERSRAAGAVREHGGRVALVSSSLRRSGQSGRHAGGRAAGALPPLAPGAARRRSGRQRAGHLHPAAGNRSRSGGERDRRDARRARARSRS